MLDACRGAGDGSDNPHLFSTADVMLAQALLSEEPFTLLQATGVRYELNGTQSTQGGDNAR
jgi:hypothetical protein